MNSRAKIGALAKTDPALLVPYGGEQRAIGELQALGVALTPEDYRAIRESFGGGKRGRTRARELVPLECPACETRLTHFDRSGREPYFAASAESSSHGPHCYAVDAIPGGEPVVDAAAKDQTVTAPADLRSPESSTPPAEPQVAEGSDTVFDDALVAEALATADRGDQALVSDEPAVDELLAQADDNIEELVPDEDEGEERVTEELVPEDLVPEGRVLGEAYYFVGAGPDLLAKADLKSRLGIGSGGPTEAVPAGATPADARELLIQALNRALPTHSTIHFRGQDHAVVAAGDVHHHEEGAPLAVYGRFTEAEWHGAAGRLVLKATTRSVQVWATSAVPRRLFQVDSNREISTPVLSKPVPFLAFGTLKKLGPTCGIPVFRSDSLVLLQPLTLPARESRDTWIDVAEQDGLTLLPSQVDLVPPQHEQPAEPRVDNVERPVPAVARTLPPAAAVATASAWTTFDEDEPEASADARSDGLNVLSPAAASSRSPIDPTPALDEAGSAGVAGSSTVAPVATPPARGGFSLRSLTAGFRRSKSR